MTFKFSCSWNISQAGGLHFYCSEILPMSAMVCHKPMTDGTRLLTVWEAGHEVLTVWEQLENKAGEMMITA